MPRDKRRRFTVEERRQLYLKAGGHCQRCGDPLGDDWQGSHLVAWSHGGATTLDNGEAWCKRCNLGNGAQNAVPPAEITLRPWQADALDVVLEQLWDTGVATVNAAPGAGKTMFAGLVHRRLVAAGFVERMLVVVPSSALRRQWVDALGVLGIHLDDEPHDGWIEHRNTSGAVVTYQSLGGTADNHLAELTDRPTAVMLDEVHHVGEAGHTAWGRDVRRIVGDVTSGEVHATAVLNITGTLFRSAGSHRISTVRYQAVEDGKIEALADYSVFTRDLVPHSLRPPYVYTYGSHVELLDMQTAEVIGGDIADLEQAQRRAVLRGQFGQKTYVEGFATEAVRLLAAQQEALGREQPLKLLCVAADQRSARRFADAFNKVTGLDFARLVISDEPGALRTLRAAARERKSLAIVSVQMVTEGFDCPAISTIAYASNVSADLRIAQTMARAMRITDTERRLGRILPAQILIPDHTELREAFAKALVNQMHILNADDEPTGTDGVRSRGEGLGPRYEVLDLSGPVLRGAKVLAADDGDVDAAELTLWEAPLRAIGVPTVYAPGVIVASRQVPQFPRIYSREEEPDGPVTRHASAREMNRGHRQRLTQMARWMAVHVDHDDRWINVQVFQADANFAADIPKGARDMASDEELARAEAWMTARIFEHCETHDEPPPGWLIDGDK